MQSEREYCQEAERQRLGGVGGYTGDGYVHYEPDPLELRTMSGKERWALYADHCGAQQDCGRQPIPFGQWIVRNW